MTGWNFADGTAPSPEWAVDYESVVNEAVDGPVQGPFGETICAVVEAAPGHTPVLEELSDHVKSHLAHYKAPRHLVIVDSIGRAPNGKVDYRRLTALASTQLGVATL